MKSKKILTLIFAVLLVFSLFGCGKKEPVADVEPQDTVEQEKLPPIVTEKDTPKQEPVELTQEELHALFKKEYDTERYAKSNLYADQYKDFYLKLPAREIGTQVDANVYSYIESAVKGAEYEGKILPDDGFEQYVEWRKSLESTNSSISNSAGGQQASSGSSDDVSGVGGTRQPMSQDELDEKLNSSSLEEDYGSPSYGVTGSKNFGGTGQNVDDTAHIRDGSGATKSEGARSDDKEYETPSYEIIG